MPDLHGEAVTLLHSPASFRAAQGRAAVDVVVLLSYMLVLRKCNVTDVSYCGS